MAVNDISVDDGAPVDAIAEAVMRNQADGIPRHVYADGRIMKWDWEIPSEIEDNLEGEALEDHIRRLMEQQNGEQG